MVLPLLLLSVGGRKVPVVEQKPWRRCLLLSGEPRRNGGDFFVGPLHVNPFAWLLAGRRPAAGSPNRSGGKARGLGSAARGLLPGGRLLPRHRGGGS